MSEEEIYPPTYLGDSVYASFDGYHIRLHLDRHDSFPIVALEPAVIEALNKYQEAIIEHFKGRPS